MKYVNANSIFPDRLLAELQKYMPGGYVYIPAPKTQRKPWGELSGYRRELELRNAGICEEYREGASIEGLADRYCLSVYAIRKIIYQK